MNISDVGIAFIAAHEGCRLEAYLDSVGIPTIGYGHVKGVQMGQIITQDEAEAYLRDDVQTAVKCVNNSVSCVLTQSMFDALVSFVYNLGCNSLRNSTLLRKVNSGDDIGASEEFGKWNHAGGVVIAGLTKRRQDEAELFLS